ncbi:MAG: hypothetical protein HQK52_01455 [Oligoflexia bacterium]|nr:hypothetical protein [Oligoflexia bacterium]
MSEFIYEAINDRIECKYGKENINSYGKISKMKISKKISHNIFRYPFVIFFVYTLLVIITVKILSAKVLSENKLEDGFLSHDSYCYYTRSVEFAGFIKSNQVNLDLIHKNIYEGFGVAVIVGCVQYLLGPYKIVLYALNAILHSLSAYLLFIILYSIYQNRRYSFYATLPFLLFVTPMYWYTQLLKDTFTIFGFFLFLYAMLLFCNIHKGNREKLLKGVPIFLCGVIISYLSRNYFLEIFRVLTFFIVSTFFVFIALRVKGKWKEVTLYKGVIAITLSVFILAILVNEERFKPLTSSKIYYIPFINKDAGGEKSIDSSSINMSEAKQKASLNYTTRYLKDKDGTVKEDQFSYLDKLLAKIKAVRFTFNLNEGRTSLDTDVVFNNNMDLIKYLPTAVGIGLFAPFPAQLFKGTGFWDTDGFMNFIIFAEMVIVYILVLGLVFIIKNIKNRFNFFIVFAISFSMTTLYGLMISNVGTLHRMRYPYLMIIVGSGLIGWISFFDSKKLKCYQNRISD